MPTLYILCGPSGSGKSTWASDFIDKHNEVWYVSRDDIRLDLLSDEEDYFSHEKEVFKTFVGILYTLLSDGKDVIADATHLNMFSRRKLIQAIDMRGCKEYEIVFVVFNTDMETCIERNKAREGRRNVPETVIRNMCRDFRAPSLDEDERAREIINV
jgi:predicted kinase